MLALRGSKHSGDCFGFMSGYIPPGVYEELVRADQATAASVVQAARHDSRGGLEQAMQPGSYVSDPVTGEQVATLRPKDIKPLSPDITARLNQNNAAEEGPAGSTAEPAKAQTYANCQKAEQTEDNF
jgi:hypothetical protein